MTHKVQFLYVRTNSVILILQSQSWGGCYSLYQVNIRRAFIYKSMLWTFPGGAVDKNLPANAGDTGSILAAGRSYMPRSI